MTPEASNPLLELESVPHIFMDGVLGENQFLSFQSALRGPWAELLGRRKFCLVYTGVLNWRTKTQALAL